MEIPSSSGIAASSPSLNQSTTTLSSPEPPRPCHLPNICTPSPCHLSNIICNPSPELHRRRLDFGRTSTINDGNSQQQRPEHELDGDSRSSTASLRRKRPSKWSGSENSYLVHRLHHWHRSSIDWGVIAEYLPGKTSEETANHWHECAQYYTHILAERYRVDPSHIQLLTRQCRERYRIVAANDDDSVDDHQNHNNNNSEDLMMTRSFSPWHSRLEDDGLFYDDYNNDHDENENNGVSRAYITSHRTQQWRIQRRALLRKQGHYEMAYTLSLDPNIDRVELVQVMNQYSKTAKNQDESDASDFDSSNDGEISLSSDDNVKEEEKEESHVSDKVELDQPNLVSPFKNVRRSGGDENNSTHDDRREQTKQFIGVKRKVTPHAKSSKNDHCDLNCSDLESTKKHQYGVDEESVKFEKRVDEVAGAKHVGLEADKECRKDDVNEKIKRKRKGSFTTTD